MSDVILRAVETVYRGYRFRSRLEARWACFFDAIGVTFEYETEGYDLGSMRYLPDFYLPQSRTYIEVKPRRGESVDRKPLAAVAAAPELFSGHAANRRHMVVVYGDPMAADADVIEWSSWRKQPDVDTGRLPVACKRCRFVSFDHRYRSIRATWGHTCTVGDVRLPVWQAFVLDAALAARQARFEHGDRPEIEARIKHRFHDAKPPLYLAGKIGRSSVDWRDRVGAPAGNREHKGQQFAVGSEIPTPYGSWTYCGPDLTVDHNEIRHGVASGCIDLLRHANMLFAWIDQPDCHGTMAELGAWYGDGAPHVTFPSFVGFGSEDLRHEVWFAADISTCSVVTPDVQQAFEAFVEWHEYWRCYQDIES